MTTQTAFDGYEIAPVIESKDGTCEWFPSLEEAKASLTDGDRIIWTLYGHLPTGGVEAIADFDTEAEAQARQRQEG